MQTTTPTTRQEAKQLISAETRKWIAQAEQTFGFKLPYIEIAFNLKGKVAGNANYSKRKIKFNLDAMGVEGGWDHLFHNTCPHEVAHMVQYMNPAWPKNRQQNPPHGTYWKRVMRSFGVDAERCHSLDLPSGRAGSSKPRRTFTYKCACKSHEITIIRHRRALKGARYTCKHCRCEITFANNI